MGTYSRRLCTIALSLIIGLSCGSAWAVLQTNLKGIELNSTPVETRILLKSDVEIPHSIVSQGAEKIVIDLSSVDPTQSVPTDFATADNIEQVILKPLGSNKLRMVIRGEHLGAAVVSTIVGSVQPKSHSSDVVFDEETGAGPSRSSRIYAPDERGNATASTPQDIKDQQLEAVASEASEGSSSATGTEQASASESDLYANESLDPDSVNFPLTPGSGDRQALVDPQSLDESTTLASDEETWQDNFAAIAGNIFAWLEKALSKMDKGILFGIVGFTGFLILLGLLISRKAGRENIFAEEMDYEPRPGFLSGLFGGGKRQRSNGNRRQGKRIFNGAEMQRPARAERMQSANERPVGLSRFSSSQTAPVEQSPIAHKNHALNQYARNAAAPVPQPPARNKEELDRELQRSLQMRQAISQTQTKKPYMNPAAPKPTTNVSPTRAVSPQARQAMPQPQQLLKSPAMPQTNRPVRNTRNEQPELPANNTEVLDFLRSVADLMEKDGHQANGIKKGMGQPPRNRFH